LVDVEKVPLVHPTGRPHDTRADRPDAHALNLHYARAGVDPASAQNGDPLPMESQSKLQQATRAADGSDIQLGISGIYRGYDDGYFYAANEGTQESPEVLAFRRKLAAEKTQAQGDASAMVANGNDPEIDEAVARSYGEKKTTAPSSESIPKAGTTIWQAAAIGDRMPQFLSAIEKKQREEDLSAEEDELLTHVETVLARAGVPIDLKDVDIDKLRQAAASRNEGPRLKTPIDAQVERDFGLSSGIPRTTIIPDPRGADGSPTWDVSQWTAPQWLYDLARAYVTPGVAATGHPISDEEALNLALTATGGSFLSSATVRKAAANSAEILASHGVKMYDGPVTERSFKKDYPDVHGRQDAAGNLTHDIDGNPLEVGGRIVGRSVVGGADEALSPTQFDAIAKEGTGRGTEVVSPSTLRRSETVGQILIDRHTRLPKGVDLSNKLTPEDLPRVYGHEIGHVIDQLAGEIPVEGLTRELKALYNVGNNPNRDRLDRDLPAAWSKPFSPEASGYKGKDIPREWMAEAIRIYMANPSYLKGAAPKTAAAIRKAVNTDLVIRKIIQFNTGGAPVPPLPSPDGGADTDPLALPPGYVYGKNFI
jgi:hypothetical protein